MKFGEIFQEDLDTIDRLISEGEATYEKWRHPDPYIGKSKIYRSFYNPNLACFYSLYNTNVISLNGVEYITGSFSSCS